jgi:dihydrofolate reductase
VRNQRLQAIKLSRKIKLFTIVARSINGCIGSQGQLPWGKIKSDLKRFRLLTTGHHLILGRATYESIGRPLPNRKMIVVTSDPAYKAEDSIVVHSLEEALNACPKGEVTWIIGGSKIYHQLLPLSDIVHLTEIDIKVLGDAYFIALGPESEWYRLHQTSWRQYHPNDEHFSRYSVWSNLTNTIGELGFDPWAGTVVMS